MKLRNDAGYDYEKPTLSAHSLEGWAHTTENVEIFYDTSLSLCT